MKISVIILGVLLCFGCSETEVVEDVVSDVGEIKQAHPSLKLDLSWLAGNWKDDVSLSASKKTFLTNWSINEGVLTGADYEFVSDSKDTIQTKTLSIDTSKDPTYCEIKIHDGKNSRTLFFKLFAYSKDSAQFVNKANPFPQDITFKRINDNEHQNILGGFVGTEYRRMIFKFKGD